MERCIQTAYKVIVEDALKWYTRRECKGVFKFIQDEDGGVNSNGVHIHSKALFGIFLNSQYRCCTPETIIFLCRPYFIKHSSYRKIFVITIKKKLRGFSPQANYTDRATAACRRS
jgi:hypothetical protein